MAFLTKYTGNITYLMIFSSIYFFFSHSFVISGIFFGFAVYLHPNYYLFIFLLPLYKYFEMPEDLKKKFKTNFIIFFITLFITEVLLFACSYGLVGSFV